MKNDASERLTSEQEVESVSEGHGSQLTQQRQCATDLAGRRNGLKRSSSHEMEALLRRLVLVDKRNVSREMKPVL